MALNKIDGVTNISKQLNRWRNFIFMCQQSRNAHVAQRPVASEPVVPSEATTKMTDNLVWSKNSPVSLIMETARRPQHNRTLELKKAAVQLSRSNESLKAHYIQKRNDRSAEELLAKELLAKEPQTVQKLANLMSLNIAMVETKGQRSSRMPARRMETDLPTGIIDFKPQIKHSPRWQYTKPSKDAIKDAKDRQKGAMKNIPLLAKQTELVEQSQEKTSDVENKNVKTEKIATTGNKLKMGFSTKAVPEDERDRQKILSKLADVIIEPVAKNLNSQAKWKFGSRSIPRLDI
ncbi:uncharacterized protein LOC108050067 isoform X2 [Drosophila rhopaloa]|uniref:Uncharacterized protein LOC108050067 isoform X2 n=1 Tax=Drosophila rhopaloa TaxID=1041015 RepID=A0A6P4FP62_DRORH|nr:uncharacterized protein LOC108050067 isoform X2 [Drosophila rhopaloa]